MVASQDFLAEGKVGGTSSGEKACWDEEDAEAVGC